MISMASWVDLGTGFWHSFFLSQAAVHLSDPSVMCKSTQFATQIIYQFFWARVKDEH